jgi:sensor histidine kinase YesM
MINKLIKEIPRATIIAITIFFVLLLIRLITGNTISFDTDLLVSFGYTMLYGLSIYFANALLFIYLDKIFEVDRFTQKRVVIGFLSSFLVSILVIFLLRVFAAVIIEQRSFSEFWREETLANYLVSIILTFIVTLAFHAFYFYKSYNENKVKEQKIIAGSASAQFESLKNQIDPHFLFNSLNVLSSLIEENPDTAQKFTTSLSKVYRYVLEQKDKELISVEEELKFAKTYMNLLKMRFENSITFEVPEFENDEAKVVPLSLQLLLENCIKHNIVSEKKPLHIKIYIEANELIIENNKQIKEVLQDRKGVGLQNIVSRYAILTRRNVIIQESETVFRVKLPILTKQIISTDTKVIASENMSYVKAKERVEKLKGFYGNLISYCCVIPLLIFINLRTSNFQWFWFPLLGWGFGLIMHAAETFGYGKAWEEKKIREILNKDNETNSKWK